MTVEEQAPPADAAPEAPAPPAAEEQPVVDVHTLPGGAHAAVEAVLMVADAPIGADRIAAALNLTQDETDDILHELADEYAGHLGSRPRGFELRRTVDGWRIYSSTAHADPVGRFVLDGQSAKLSQAALETLAVIAYRQPVSRGQMSAVRGVSVDGVVRTLLTRGLIAEIGQDPSSGAVLFGTTGYFLERMDFSSLDELPPLAPHLPDLDMIDGLDGLDS
ncbi:SMC-Scp complex subunit ScpB [Promicromonospora sp. MEB111]|uniref:SMC-Scp complex subunit ScpB n=1 Tax=unclassified Promicromonospora TaxID=2647929 RepID=UPI00254B50EA|nr:SMC-Scp complex subunit ScpB [Promicromonospora sp. MEB111]